MTYQTLHPPTRNHVCCPLLTAKEGTLPEELPRTHRHELLPLFGALHLQDSTVCECIVYSTACYQCTSPRPR